MMPLAVLGIILMSVLVGWGVWAIAKNISLNETTERYRYVKTKDEDGNEITKVIDLDEEKK